MTDNRARPGFVPGPHMTTERLAPEPSAEADAALEEGLLLAHYEHVKGCPTMDGRRGPCNCHYWDDLMTIRAALSHPATPPLDVERLAEAIDNHDDVCSSMAIPECAGDIAKRYAALANPDPETAS